jgi:ligand-binding sensor domain-containing protein
LTEQTQFLVNISYFNIKIYLLTLLAYCCPGQYFTAEAQTPVMRKYTLLDGYTATNGYVIKQDGKGYLWLGTDNGALRFDGKKFQVFRDRSMPADQEILSCNPYGKDQVLLVPLLNNIAYYKDGEVISGRKDHRLNPIRNIGQNNVFTDIFTRNIWLSDENKLKTLYCFSANDIKKVDVPDAGLLIIAVRNNRVICFNRKERMLKQYDLKKKCYKPIYDSRMKPVFCNGLIETREDGKYIFVNDQSERRTDVYTFRNDSTLYLTKTILRLPSSKKSVIFTDSALNIWFKYLNGGVAYLGMENDRSVVRPFNFMDKTVINYLFIDQQKNIWMTGQNNSLYFLSYKHFQNALRVHDALPCPAIPKSINGDNQGNIALGYVNEKIFSIRKNGKLKHYRLNQNFYEGVRCICPLSNNRFLIMDKDLALVDGRKNNIHYFNSPSTYKDMSLYVDGGLLVASQNNAFYLYPGNVTSGLTDSNKQIIFKGRASSIASLSDSTVLVGTPDGLFIKKGLWARASRIHHPELSHINITDIAAKGGDVALISTNGQGIYYFDSRNGTAKAIRLFHDAVIVRRIFKQNDSLYWLATEKGAYEVQLDKECNVKHMRNYTFYDGLPSNNITGVYVYRDTAFITTSEGPGIIPLLDTTILQMRPPLVYINSIHLHDTLLSRPVNEVKLSYRQNEIMISLSAISYESFGNINYRYKLEGLSDDWTETNNAEIYFSGLAPGTYLFKAYASNAKGINSKIPVTFSIRILPAFWQTLLFKAVVCLIAALLFYFFIRRRANRLASRKYEQARQERRLAELELEAIKAHINPHFIYNCLNSIQYFNYEKQHDLSRKYLDLFAQLIRFTIQYSRQTFISITEETAYLKNYLQLEKMRFRERLQYHVVVADSIDGQLMIPAMLIQPYVENALKHGIAAKKDGGTVIIRFTKPEENLLEISIEDNGAGFTPEHNADNSSLGLRLSGSRAETYNQLFDMKIQINFHNKKNLDPNESGTIVKIKIPIIS